MPIIDLSSTIENVNVSRVDQVEIEYSAREVGAAAIEGMMSVPRALLRDLYRLIANRPEVGVRPQEQQ